MAVTTTAAHFASLHRPGDPLVIPNIWDLSSLNTVLSLNTSETSTPVKAVATASYAIAATLGLADEDLSLGANLIRIRSLSPRVRAAGLPLTVDIQDAYGDRLEDVVAAVVEAGAVGANVEDMKDEKDVGEEGGDLLYTLEEQVERLKRVLKSAEEKGCEGFVVNARCDVMSPASRRGAIDESAEEGERLLGETVRRGKAYLEAGATTVFVWGGSQRGLRDAEVRALSDAFGGRLAVKLGTGDGALSVRELADIGVARISVGPSLFQAANKTVREAAERIVGGGRL
ncbi:phosphoenolpyruvate phosphomutase-domain-containing protein [Xylaria bambusicola]|uniref:phosphoenolpyruvate phosphomutase-domain-containing protein n=1 Tax=Xylaria bambusicola TaxID=326684 RepID=UPI00200744C2|nr:phosphoenolpyruvate phosphomutase-domain-containing protein [Xylaria bambusicola]KAI0503203.1 phosphoenolpyruvate phosphomutase-domain-containing protein [Xylaria bambusicola]